jgi:hypothetical protein
MRLKYALFSFCALTLSFASKINAQVVGGTHAFEYLNLSNSAHMTALGGYAPAQPTQDVTLAWQNPSMYRPGLHNQLAFNYNMYYADIKAMNLQYAYHVDKWGTTIGGGVQNINYGSFVAADIYGTPMGEVRANDMVVNLSAARSYGERWRYGATLKYANSVLADKNAGALLVDVGVTYVDTANKITLGIVSRNMGFMTKKYSPANRAEPLPFDLNIGFTKELENLPLKIFVVAHHLYQWDIRYNNPADKRRNIFNTDSVATKEKKHFVDKAFRHLNLGAELTLGKRLALTLAYSHLRRMELSTLEGKGMAGFSFGGSLYLNKLQVHYGRSVLATAGAYNELGLNLQLDKLFSVGNKTNSWHWNNDYPNW